MENLTQSHIPVGGCAYGGGLTKMAASGVTASGTAITFSASGGSNQRMRQIRICLAEFQRRNLATPSLAPAPSNKLREPFYQAASSIITSEARWRLHTEPKLVPVEFSAATIIVGIDNDVAGALGVGLQQNLRRPTSKRLRIGWRKEFHEKRLLNHLA